MSKFVTITLKKIPADVRQDFKSLCAKNGINMQDKILDLMKNELADNDIGSKS